MATIKDVAKLAGVSTSTVSRALSKKVRVDDATMERVLSAVKRLGYKPNPMAKGLKEGYSLTLALVLPDITNPFFPKLVKSVEQCALEKGYSLILCDSGNDADAELRYLDAMKSHFVDGVLYIPVADGAARAKMLGKAGVPLVIVNRDFDAGFPCVTNDNFNGAKTVIEYLFECGHRRISCLIAPTLAQHYEQRLQGCIQEFERRGIRDYEKYLISDVTGIEDAYRHTKRLLAEKERPTAFFACVDIMTIGVYSGIHESGLSVPGDVSVAGFDNISIAPHMVPPLTTYEHPVDRIARKAVTELIDQITGKVEAAYRSIAVFGSLIVRKSVRRIERAKDSSPTGSVA